MLDSAEAEMLPSSCAGRNDEGATCATTQESSAPASTKTETLESDVRVPHGTPDAHPDTQHNIHDAIGEPEESMVPPTSHAAEPVTQESHPSRASLPTSINKVEVRLKQGDKMSLHRN
eukprot:6477519-Amphidinium_carterae.1